MPVLLVFLGAGMGGVLRYVSGLVAAAWVGAAFPWGTFAINVIGCLMIGICARTLPFDPDRMHPLRLLVMTGVLGGFTTYSSFSLEAVGLWQRGDAGQALFYTFGTLVLCIAGAAIGLSLGRWVAP